MCPETLKWELGLGTEPWNVPTAGAEAAAGVAAETAAGAEGRGRVGGQLGALPGLATSGPTSEVKQSRGRRGGRLVGLVRQGCGRGDL